MERFNAFELGDDMRLKRLRDDWADDARSRSLAVQEWRAAMENRPPFLDDGTRKTPGESVHARHGTPRIRSVRHRRQPQQRGGRRRIPGSDARGPAHVRHAARTLRAYAGRPVDNGHGHERKPYTSARRKNLTAASNPYLRRMSVQTQKECPPESTHPLSFIEVSRVTSFHCKCHGMVTDFGGR